MSNDNRINHEIKSLTVVVIDNEGENLGEIKKADAMKMAQDLNLDLVEVSPNSKPPVCKFMDYGKYKYNKSKKAHDAKKKQKTIQLKEVKLTPKTDKHDIEFKVNHVKRFLADGNKAKITVVFKGREMVHPEVGMRVLKTMQAALEEVSIVEQSPKQEGRHLSMILIQKVVAPEPKPKTKAVAPEPKKETETVTVKPAP